MFAVALMCAQVTLAQSAAVRSFDAERLDFNPGGQASLIVGSGDTLPEGGTRISLVGAYQFQPLVLFDFGQRVGAVITQRATAHLLAAWSVAKWIEVGLQIPVVVFQNGEDIPEMYGTPKIPVAALGSSWVQGRVSILRERDGAIADAAVQISVKFPGSSLEGYTRDAWVGVSPRLSAGTTLFHAFRVGGEAAYTFRNVAQLGPVGGPVNDEVGSELNFGLVLSTVRKSGINGELSARMLVPLSRTGFGAELYAGLRYTLGKYLEAFVLGGPGLGRTVGIPLFRVMAGLSFEWEPGPSRRTPDSAPTTEDLSPIPSGTPLTDADKDGVLDRDDGCPLDPGPADNKGCPATL